MRPGKERAAGVEAAAVHVPDMHPAQGIIDTAVQNGCGLIVMFSHGCRDAGRLTLGSQTADVVTHTTLPVLVIG